MVTVREASTWPSVSAPWSPNSAASGASPTPSPSHTTTMARVNGPNVSTNPGRCRREGHVSVREPIDLGLVAEPGHLALRVAHGVPDHITPRLLEIQAAERHRDRLLVADRLQRTQVRRVARE